MRVTKPFPLIPNLAGGKSRAVQVAQVAHMLSFDTVSDLCNTVLTTQSYGLQLTPVKGCLEVCALPAVHPREGGVPYGVTTWNRGCSPFA